VNPNVNLPGNLQIDSLIFGHVEIMTNIYILANICVHLSD